MNRAVCAAIGLVLFTVATPTVSLANDDPTNVTNYDNSRAGNAQAVRATGKRIARSSPTSRVAKRATPARQTVRTSAALGSPRWIAVARQYAGTNPTGRRSLWCADFLNLVLKRSGLQGTSSSTARSFASYGKRLSAPKVGAIAVLSRGRNGGHVGIVTGIEANGKLRLISGNHNNRVAEASYPRGRVIAYVWPTS